MVAFGCDMDSKWRVTTQMHMSGQNKTDLAEMAFLYISAKSPNAIILADLHFIACVIVASLFPKSRCRQYIFADAHTKYEQSKRSLCKWSMLSLI